MPGMGGMPGMRRGPAADTTKLYKTLGVSKDADPGQLKKAYRKLSLKYHPDKPGGDEEKFKEITHAFEVLSDEEKRNIYDDYGEEGLSQHQSGGGGMDPTDVFAAMFGGGGGRSRGPRKGEDVVHRLNVSLNDLYNGRTSKLAIVRNRVCSGCNGCGAKDPKLVTTCRSCNGEGVKIHHMQIAPGMVQRVQAECNVCGGVGSSISPLDKCVKCNGDKVVKDRKVLEVHIAPGMQSGQKITFAGEANDNPGLVPGDVVVTLEQTEHPTFVRKGSNLIMVKEISLVDALCGVSFTVQQLDGRFLHIQSPPGATIKPDSIKSVPNEGMPTWKRPYDKGYLFVRFKVNFPTNINARQAHALVSVLGPRTPPDAPPDGFEVEECPLLDFSEEHARQTQNGGEAYDEDDGEDGRPRVQCAQQ